LLKIDASAAHLGRRIIELVSKKDVLSDDLLSQYYYCEGIQFLNEHLKHYGEFDLTADKLKYFFSLPNGDSVFERSIHLGMSKLNSIDGVLLLIDKQVQAFESDLMDMVGKYLPGNFHCPDITIYFLFGIRGTAIVLDNKIAVDLCDNSLYENGNISLNQLQCLLAHEIHHIGVSAAFQEFSKHITNKKELIKYSIIESLVSEGMACFYFTPDIAIHNNTQWNANLTDIDTKINNLMQYLGDSNNTESDLTVLQDSLFDDGLLGYTIGYVMIEKIHNFKGLYRVISLLCDFNLFDTYMALEEL